VNHHFSAEAADGSKQDSKYQDSEIKNQDNEAQD